MDANAKRLSRAESAAAALVSVLRNEDPDGSDRVALEDALAVVESLIEKLEAEERKS